MDIIKVVKIDDTIRQESKDWKEREYPSPKEFELELFYKLSFVVIDGEVELTVNGTKYDLKKDDFVLINQLAKSSWKINNSLKIKFNFNISN